MLTECKPNALETTVVPAQASSRARGYSRAEEEQTSAS